MFGRLQTFFKFGNASPRQPTNETTDVPVGGRHSPKEIACLRCSQTTFFNISAESAREKLESRFEENGAEKIRLVRRLPDAEVAGYYDELLPLLCIDFPSQEKLNPHPYRTDDIRIRKQGMKIHGVIIDGKTYDIDLFPARKKYGSPSSVLQQRLESTTSVVCGWTLKLRSREYWQRLAEHPEHVNRTPLLIQRANFLSLKDLASFAVVHQVAGNVDGLLGIIPNTVIAYLKGQ